MSAGGGPILGPRATVRAPEMARVVKMRTWSGVLWAEKMGEVRNIAEQRTKTQRNEKRRASLKATGTSFGDRIKDCRIGGLGFPDVLRFPPIL